MTFPDFLYFYLRILNIEIKLIFILCPRTSGAPLCVILRRFRLRENVSFKSRAFAAPRHAAWLIIWRLPHLKHGDAALTGRQPREDKEPGKIKKGDRRLAFLFCLSP